ncbi:PMT family glycosyltransferase, 4-amino-4-deoxy-L-arabinose transferase [Terriglobus roseus DSM 18391]|uniref:PMT family glycosyltransferase, 4-amino-4-deoxy-L-arabinose transferase n=1 Tax=Terriglobus roseus (strain DSM 18391 / NRRL B-41598 / KBS 63) TaxID=926566 RepID=I3ZDI4_TERRK|nr:PMT family glycosyltransferase, 4-amino-4-deoxy-L-arabinose transferase [Terriglobus roseus DSM 18391]
MDASASTLPGEISLTRAIRSHPWRAFLALTVLYVVAVTCLSSLKLLWLDELFTLHVARLGSVAAIWHALAMGADPNPPVIHVLVHFCRLLFGEREFALRLPAMVGYWIGLVSLFTYLRRRVPAEWALGGTVLSMTMAAFDYSFESRSYGIFYGLAMLAFLSWSETTETRHSRRSRYVWLLVMIAALGLGISTNYFAVLAFLPITAGEVARTVRLILKSRHDTYRNTEPNFLRLIDWRIWLGLALAISPLLVFLPLINRDIAQFAPHAWNKVSIDQVFDSYTEMVETILYPLLALFAVAAIKLLLFSPKMNGYAETAANDDAPRVLPVHELVGIVFLMLYPFLGYLVASVRGGMLSPRFVIPVCFGFAVSGALTAYRLSGRSRIAGPVFLCFVLAWFVSRESVVGYDYSEQKQCFHKVVDRLPLAFAGLPADAPLAIPDPLMALTFQHYAPPVYASRAVFPVDFQAIRKFRRDDSPEQNLWAARSLYTLRIVPMATFQKTVGKYVVLASDGNWLLKDLDRHHYAEHRLPINTRAGAIGGFTPLSHGLPVFYVADGVAVQTGPLSPELLPIPFRLQDNLPESPDLQ